MTAGLPNRAKLLGVIILVVTAWLLIVPGALGGDVQTGSCTVQTSSATMDEILSCVMGSTFLPPDDQLMLVTTITGALDANAITPGEMSALLHITAWESAADAAQAEFASQALVSVLNLMLTDQVGFTAAKSYLEQAMATGDLSKIPPPQSEGYHPGVQLAISRTADKFNYSNADIQAVLTKVTELIEKDGVPAGIVLRTVNSLIRAGAAPDAIIAALDALATSIAQGTPPGKSANTATNTGNQHQKTTGKKLCPHGNNGNGNNPPPAPAKKKHHHSESSGNHSNGGAGKK